MKQALSGIRVVDLSHYIAGPYCTKLLADYGAEVIKIEKPQAGDGGRGLPPFFADRPGLERSGLFCFLNTNKQGITLDLKTDRGREIVCRLMSQADVVVENFRPGVLERLGLSAEVLERVNPRLVHTSISNFGSSGPYRDYSLTDGVAYALGGWTYPMGELDRPPVHRAEPLASMWPACTRPSVPCRRSATGPPSTRCSTSRCRFRKP